ncbi:STAS domain-containing protein [Pseudomonas asiatica]|uniref:STAS domain-containing protein n=1 Tax=Pseudomonas asiatica TaxID=2219225 RepID=UPI003D18E33C
MAITWRSVLRWTKPASIVAITSPVRCSSARLTSSSQPSTSKEALNKVTIDLNRAHFWDITAVAALDKVVIKFRREGTEVEVLGLNEASATIVDRFGVHDKPDAIDQLMGH